MDYEEAYNKYTTLADIILGNTRVSADAIQAHPQPSRTKGLASRATEKAQAKTEEVIAATAPEEADPADVLAQYIAGIRASGADTVGTNLLEGLPDRAIERGGPRKFNTGKPSQIGLRFMQQLMGDYGMSVDQAAAIVGNLAHESGNFSTLQEVNPLVKGSRGGYGYAQWTGSRRDEFEAYAKAAGLSPDSFEANYGNFKRELDTTSEGSVLGKLQSAKSLEEGVRLFGSGFLRPSEDHANYNSRIAYAEAYANAYPNYVSKRG